MKVKREIIPELTLNWKLTEEMIIRFIASEVQRAGFERVVVGLSGGVDSALATLLAVKALGGDKVIPVMMPYKTSDPASLKDAEDFIARFKLKAETVDISPMVDAFLEARQTQDPIRRGNVMARVRMMVLFDVAAEMKALVLGTGNKTEILLGYTTWYGDSACSLNPIGDLYKTQVWALASAMGIPDSIVEKAPSADLWKGQTDEGELGLTYEEMDKILYRLVDKRMSRAEVIGEGFPTEKVDKIGTRIKRYHFKRVMPPIAKLSPRTVGKDFLYSRDWGS